MVSTQRNSEVWPPASKPLQPGPVLSSSPGRSRREQSPQAGSPVLCSQLPAHSRRARPVKVPVGGPDQKQQARADAHLGSFGHACSRSCHMQAPPLQPAACERAARQSMLDHMSALGACPGRIA